MMPAAPDWTASLAAGSGSGAPTWRRQVMIGYGTCGEEEKKLTVLRRDDSLHQDRHRGDALQPLNILHIHNTNTALKITQDAMTRRLRRQQNKAYLPAEGAVDLSSNVGRQPGVIGLQTPNRPPSVFSFSRREKVDRNANNSEADTNLVHLAKVQALEVLQRQERRQNEPAPHRSQSMSRGMNGNAFWGLTWQGWMAKSKNRPVLDVGFTAAQARGVHGERDRLEPSPLGPSHQLLHHLPVLVHLYKCSWHTRKKTSQRLKETAARCTP